MLGAPLTGITRYERYSQCAVFTNYLFCLNANSEQRGNPWEFIPIALGEVTLERDPKAAKTPDVALTPAAQLYVSALGAFGGRSWHYWLGPTLTTAVCEPEKGTCYQAFKRQILTFPQGDIQDPALVKLSPLGTQNYGR
jgi:hypothetical protein